MYTYQNIKRLIILINYYIKKNTARISVFLFFLINFEFLQQKFDYKDRAAQLFPTQFHLTGNTKYRIVPPIK